MPNSSRGARFFFELPQLLADLAEFGFESPVRGISFGWRFLEFPGVVFRWPMSHFDPDNSLLTLVQMRQR